MRKVLSLLLTLCLCPLSVVAGTNTGADDSASRDLARPLRAELQVRPVLEPGRLEPLARNALQPNFHRRSTPPVLHLTSEGTGKVAIGIGAGLAAVGIALAATAYERKTVTEPIFIQGPGYTITGSQTYTTSGTNMGKRWGGIAVAGGGGALVIYGIIKLRD